MENYRIEDFEIEHITAEHINDLFPAVLIVEHFTIFFIVNLQLNALISILKLNRLVNI